MEDEEESFIWNEETEDPLRIDPLQFSPGFVSVPNSLKATVKKEHGLSELKHQTIKSEPNSNYQDETFRPSCSNTSPQIQGLFSNEYGSNANDQDLAARLFPCKMCKMPYRMVCGSTLMIKGFCNDCLHSSNKGYPRSCYDKSIENVYSKCSVCYEKFSDSNKFNAHLKSINTCKTCNKKFCTTNEFKEHLATHDSSHTNKFNVDSLKEVGGNNGIYSLEKQVNSFINKISDDLIRCEEISGNVPEKRKKESPCKKLVPEKNSMPVNKAYSKIRCLLCGKLLPKELIQDHMNETHSDKALSSDCNKQETKSDLFSNPSPQSSDVDKKVTPSRKNRPVKHVTKINSPDTSLSTINLKNEVKLSFCKYEYVCELCSVQYDDLTVLKEHVLSDKHVNMIVTIIGINLSCKLCKASFSNISDLKSHLIQDSHVINYHIKKSEVSMHCCNICNKTFINESDFRTHELLEGHQVRNIKDDNSYEGKATGHEKQENVVACLNEKKISVHLVDKKEAVVKKDSRRKKRLLKTCKTCNKKFTVVSSLKTHVKRFNHEPCVEFDDLIRLNNSRAVNSSQKDVSDRISVQKNEEGNELQCKICKRVFATIYNVKRHAIICDRLSAMNKLDSSGASTRPENNENTGCESNVKTYDCKVCGESYQLAQSLKRHIRMLKHYQSSSFLQRSRNLFNTSAQKVEDQNFLCGTCNKMFISATSLRKHCTILNHNIVNEKVTEHRSRSFICKICKSKFNCQGSLLFHYCNELHNHYSKVRVNCICCNKTFKTLALFIHHAKRKQHVEESIKTYVNCGTCIICSVKFENVLDLKSHIISNYHIGMYVKHLFDNKEKVWAVNTNTNITSVKSTSKIHKCKYCNKSFSYHSLLTDHVKIHEKGALNYKKCNICQKRFRDSHLQRHIKEFHGEKKEICPICGKKFFYPYLVRLHINNAHNKL